MARFIAARRQVVEEVMLSDENGSTESTDATAENINEESSDSNEGQVDNGLNSNNDEEPLN